MDSTKKSGHHGDDYGSPSLRIKWDLKTVELKPDFERDIFALARRKCGKAFLKENRPAGPPAKAEDAPNIDKESTRQGSSQAFTFERVRSAEQQLYDEKNEQLYDMVMDSTLMDAATRNQAERLFKPTLDGKSLLSWVLSFCSEGDPMQQASLKQRLEALRLEADASTAEMESFLKDIEVDYPKVKMFDQSDVAFPVAFALARVDASHRLQSMYSTLRALQTAKVATPFESFTQFREAMVKQATDDDAMALAVPKPIATAGGVFATAWRPRSDGFSSRAATRVGGTRPPPTNARPGQFSTARVKPNNCGLCDCVLCDNPESHPDKCVLFSPHKRVWQKGGPKVRVWIRVQRIWIEDQLRAGKRITTMKGVRVPQDYMRRKRTEWAAARDAGPAVHYIDAESLDLDDMADDEVCYVAAMFDEADGSLSFDEPELAAPVTGDAVQVAASAALPSPFAQATQACMQNATTLDAPSAEPQTLDEFDRHILPRGEWDAAIFNGGAVNVAVAADAPKVPDPSSAADASLMSPLPSAPVPPPPSAVTERIKRADELPQSQRFDFLPPEAPPSRSSGPTPARLAESFDKAHEESIPPSPLSITPEELQRLREAERRDVSRDEGLSYEELVARRQAREREEQLLRRAQAAEEARRVEQSDGRVATLGEVERFRDEMRGDVGHVRTAVARLEELIVMQSDSVRSAVASVAATEQQLKLQMAEAQRQADAALHAFTSSVQSQIASVELQSKASAGVIAAAERATTIKNLHAITSKALRQSNGKMRTLVKVVLAAALSIPTVKALAARYPLACSLLCRALKLLCAAGVATGLAAFDCARAVVCELVPKLVTVARTARQARLQRDDRITSVQPVAPSPAPPPAAFVAALGVDPCADFAFAHRGVLMMLRDSGFDMARHDVAMLAQSSRPRRPILIDTGATAMITGSREGLVGDMCKLPASASFAVLGGTQAFDTQGFFIRTIADACGNAVTFSEHMYFREDLPFDIFGRGALAAGPLAAMFIDADPLQPPSSTNCPMLCCRLAGDLKLHLARSPNGLDWITYALPGDARVGAFSSRERELLQVVRAHVAMPAVESTGVGMGSLNHALSDLERLILKHKAMNHASLETMWVTEKQSIGGHRIPIEAYKLFAKLGCPECTALKLKLAEPVKRDGKAAAKLELKSDDNVISVGFDSFGKVATPSYQFNYHFANIFVILGTPCAFLYGSATLDADTVESMWRRFSAFLRSHVGSAVEIVRVHLDSFSTHKGKQMMQLFEDMLTHPTFSPPGQHSFLGEVERWWWPLLKGCVLNMKGAGMNRRMWFKAMSAALDVQCASAARLHATDNRCGYAHLLRQFVNFVGDLYPFGAPGLFATDPAAKKDKWQSTAVQGFWCGRNIDCVLRGVRYSCEFFDGVRFRVVVYNFRIHVHKFINLTPNGSKLLPDWPHEAEPIDAAKPSVDGAKQIDQQRQQELAVLDATPHNGPSPFDASGDAAPAAVVPNGQQPAAEQGSMRGARASTRLQRHDRPASVQPPAVPLQRVPPAVVPPPPRSKAVEYVLVPSSEYPSYACVENGGKGWDARVVSKSKQHVTVSYLHAVDGAGRKWANDTLHPSAVVWGWLMAGACMVAVDLAPLQLRDDGYSRRMCGSSFGGDAAAAEIQHACILTIERPLPSQAIIINLFSGDYHNMEGISALLRSGNVGVFDVDNDPHFGGGPAADILINAVFNLLITMVKARKVIGLLAQPKCSPGSVIRTRADGPTSESVAGEWPRMVFKQGFPRGLPDLSPAYAKEVDTCLLVGFRTCYLAKLLYSFGGWFLIEGPAVRGNESMPLSYNPKFADHLNVIGTAPYTQLITDTHSVVLESHACMAEKGYPQKATNWIASPNVEPSLQRDLEELVCNHLRHDINFNGQPHGLPVASSERFPPGIASVIAKGLLRSAPTGGPSFQLGKSSVTDWLKDVLNWRDGALVKSLGHDCSLHHATAAVLRESIDDLDPVGRPYMPELTYFACLEDDPRTTTAEWFLLDVDDARNVCLCLVDEHHYLRAAVFGVLPAVSSDWLVPQTDTELNRSPQKVIWLGADQDEISRLWGIPAFAEVLEGDPWIKPDMRISRTRFVRTLKVSTSDGKITRTPRSRLVCMGMHDEEGKQYKDKSTPTPSFSSVLVLCGEATVALSSESARAQGCIFSFDMTQYFQTVKCDVPCGGLLFKPPGRYARKEDGRAVYWRAVNWLQGAKGAGAAARAEFVRLMTSPNDLIVFHVACHDKCVFIHSSPAGKVRFALHGDDGCCGWSTSRVLAEQTRALITSRWPDAKWSYDWGKMLGFMFAFDKPSRGYTTVSAPIHIENLRAYVRNEMPMTPKMPSSKSIMELEPGVVPPIGHEDREQYEKDVEFMCSSSGCIQYTCKVRADVVQAQNMTCRYDHCPTPKVIKARKQIIWYLLSTPDVGIVFGGGAGLNWSDLILKVKLPVDFELDPHKHHFMYYHVVVDSNLHVDRSTNGINHMFAGAAALPLSFRQPSSAITAHDGEMFAYSAAVAQSLVFRGLLQELEIIQSVPTPVFSDSRSTVICAKNSSSLKKSLHILRRVLFMYEAMSDEEIDAYSVQGKKNPSDAFTKYVDHYSFAAAMYYVMRHAHFLTYDVKTAA